MPQLNYPGYNNFLFSKETFAIIGACIEVHKYLGRGFLESVYKEALLQEFNLRNIVYEREKKYNITYKGFVLPQFYVADFVIDNKIILEIKAQEKATETHYRQVINYLAVTNFKLGLLVNFGEDSLVHRRIALNKFQK